MNYFASVSIVTATEVVLLDSIRVLEQMHESTEPLAHVGMQVDAFLSQLMKSRKNNAICSCLGALGTESGLEARASGRRQPNQGSVESSSNVKGPCSSASVMQRHDLGTVWSFSCSSPAFLVYPIGNEAGSLFRSRAARIFGLTLPFADLPHSSTRSTAQIINHHFPLKELLSSWTCRS